eukprot:scaffold29479_cov21-Cyclotella_meneghiniana.AAC.1
MKGSHFIVNIGGGGTKCIFQGLDDEFATKIHGSGYHYSLFTYLNKTCFPSGFHQQYLCLSASIINLCHILGNKDIFEAMEASPSLYFVGRLEDVGQWYQRYMNRKNGAIKQKSEHSIEEELDDGKFFHDHRNTLSVVSVIQQYERESVVGDESVEAVTNKLRSSLSWDKYTTKYARMWDRKFALLQSYINDNGHTPPYDYKVKDGDEEIALGEWVHEQRKQKNKNTLSSERQQRLDSIGFVWNPSRRGYLYSQSTKFTREWDRKFALLESYKNDNGHTRVPYNYKVLDGGEEIALGCWVTNLRREKRNKDKGAKKGLSLERQERLDSIGFIWNGLNWV